MTNRYSAALVAGFLFIGGHAPRAQSVQNSRSADRNPLARAKSLKCTFSLNTAGGWVNDVAQAQTKVEDTSLDIDSIDTAEGTARIAGSNSDITALLTASSLHFLERSFSGNLTVTTVFAQEGPKGKYRAVRSRHDYLPVNIPGLVSAPTVVQYYGACEMGV